MEHLLVLSTCLLLSLVGNIILVWWEIRQRLRQRLLVSSLTDENHQQLQRIHLLTTEKQEVERQLEELESLLEDVKEHISLLTTEKQEVKRHLKEL